MREFLGRYMPIDASEHGAALDRLNANVHWLMLILFLGWSAYFVYALWRFRASKNPRASYVGTRSHFSTYSEAGVAVVELVLLIGFSIPLWYRWTRPVARDKNPVEVRVVAEQFAWNIHYPGADGRFGKTDVKLVSSTNPLGIDAADPYAKDDIANINQLHLPVNRPIVVRLYSKDVIHSFSLPVMRAKQDSIPGMEIPIHFTARMTNEGRQWEIGCAQLCGLGHYRMRGQLYVHPEAEFDKWLTEQPLVADTLTES